MDILSARLIICIVGYGDAEQLVALTKSAGARGGTILHGRGTAQQKWLQMLGLGDSAKEIVFTVACEPELTKILTMLRTTQCLSKSSGIAITLPISMLIRRSHSEKPFVAQGKGENMLESSHELITVIVNTGYADDVMVAAREAGATGGTIINARGTGKEEDVTFFGVPLVPEKECLLILVQREKTQDIMNAICELPCLKQAGMGIAFCMDVEQFIPLGVQK